MKFSRLQEYILIQALNSKNQLIKKKLLDYYLHHKRKPERKDQLNIIHKSINRLIDKGLLIGYGRRTKEKWFYTSIRLTAKGRKLAKNISKQRQQKLPFKR